MDKLAAKFKLIDEEDSLEKKMGVKRQRTKVEVKNFPEMKKKGKRMMN